MLPDFGRAFRPQIASDSVYAYPGRAGRSFRNGGGRCKRGFAQQAEQAEARHPVVCRLGAGAIRPVNAADLSDGPARIAPVWRYTQLLPTVLLSDETAGCRRGT